MESTTANSAANSPPRVSSVRWSILRRAFLSASSSSSNRTDDRSEMEIRRVSRKTASGFNMIPFHLRNEHLSEPLDAFPKIKEAGSTKDACICYTLPTATSQKLILFQRIKNSINHNDFEISEKYNIDNTGLVCCWPSEDVLAYFCLNHVDMFRSKRVLELGSGYGLAGLTIAAGTDAHEVIISDGNPQVINYIQQNITANAGIFGDTIVQSMMLHWNQELDSRMLNSFDIIIASDCTFFKEFHESLALTVKSLLRHSDTSEALFLNPKRGDSLDKFTQKLQDVGLHYKVVENYDSQVWKRHLEFLDGTDTSWACYDKDHSYPLLVSQITRESSSSDACGGATAHFR